MKPNLNRKMIACFSILLVSVVFVAGQYKKQQRLSNESRSFHIINLRDGDVLSGDITITANVLGDGYSYTDVWMVVDGQSVETQPSQFNASGKPQLQFRLATNHFSNGPHSVCLSGPNSSQCRKVTFRNTLFSVRYKDTNKAAEAVKLGRQPRAEGMFKATVANPKLNLCWVVMIQSINGSRVRTIYGHGEEVYLSWEGRNDAGRKAPADAYVVKAGAGPTQTAALKSALKSSVLGHISTWG